MSDWSLDICHRLYLFNRLDLVKGLNGLNDLLNNLDLWYLLNLLLNLDPIHIAVVNDWRIVCISIPVIVSQGSVCADDLLVSGDDVIDLNNRASLMDDVCMASHIRGLLLDCVCGGDWRGHMRHYRADDAIRLVLCHRVRKASSDTVTLNDCRVMGWRTEDCGGRGDGQAGHKDGSLNKNNFIIEPKKGIIFQKLTVCMLKNFLGDVGPG
jgi:hypothetical protein